MMPELRSLLLSVVERAFTRLLCCRDLMMSFAHCCSLALLQSFARLLFCRDLMMAELRSPRIMYAHVCMYGCIYEYVYMHTQACIHTCVHMSAMIMM